MSDPKKLCFVIGPIGAEGTTERIKADWLLIEVIKRVLEEDPFSFEVKRADEFADPGLITDQVINAALDADLAIADLTGSNPNAFYELAIRHMAEKPVIHMAESGVPIPFDIKDYRTVVYKLTHPNDLAAARKDLSVQTKAILASGYQLSNPITKARGHQKLKESGDSRDKIVTELATQVRGLESQIKTIAIATGVERPRSSKVVWKDSPSYSVMILKCKGCGRELRAQSLFDFPDECPNCGHPTSIPRDTPPGVNS